MQKLTCAHEVPERGEMVLLQEQPTGCLSQHYPVTVGRSYKVLDYMGSCLVVTTDVEGGTASIWRGRFTRTVH